MGLFLKLYQHIHLQGVFLQLIIFSAGLLLFELVCRLGDWKAR